MAKAKNGRKKPRSAKQKAATRKLVAANKRRGRKTPTKRRKASKPRRKAATKRKSNKQRKTTKHTVAKKKGLFDQIPLIKNTMFKKAAIGVGTATLGAAVLGLVIPSLAAHPIVKPVLALAGGGAIGAVAQVLTQGGLSGLLPSGLGGGSSTQGGGFNPAFA